MKFVLPKKDDFAHKVYAKLLRLEKGKVTTYGALAKAIGSKGSSRAVGMVLGKNPYIPDVPCHRVVASNGSLNGYVHGLDEKEKMLLAEGIEVVNGKVPEKFIVRLL